MLTRGPTATSCTSSRPFDPLVLQRKRTQLFFGYQHRFEAYLPPEKRVFGYFAQPVLIGDEIVAAIDLKTDRSRGKLLLQKWTWVAKGARRSAGGGSKKRCTASSASSSRRLRTDGTFKARRKPRAGRFWLPDCQSAAAGG